MARYSRYRRYRRGRRRYYYGRRRYRRSYGRRYVNGSSKSSIRMKCVVTYSYHSTSGHGTDLGNVLSVMPYMAANSTSVVNSPLYQAYCNLYEETKLIGFKCQLSVTSIVGNATLPSLQIWTSFDRRAGYTESSPTAAQIQSAATSNVATALNNNVAKISRSIYASDLLEKAQWHDSSLGTVNGVQGDVAWLTAGLNPNFFCPRMDFCFGSPARESDTQVDWTISTTYYVAFRNPKFGGLSSAKELASKDVSIPDEDEDMDPYDEDTLLGTDYLQESTGPARAAAAADPLVDTTASRKKRVVSRTAHVPITSTKN